MDLCVFLFLAYIYNYVCTLYTTDLHALYTCGKVVYSVVHLVSDPTIVGSNLLSETRVITIGKLVVCSRADV